VDDPHSDGDAHDVELRLPYRPPLAIGALIGFLAARAVPGVEQVVGSEYQRVLRLPGGPAVVALRAEDAGAAPRRDGDRGADAGGSPDRERSAASGGPPGHGDAGGSAPLIRCWLRRADPRDEAQAVGACRRLLDLDADPGAVDGALGDDPALAPLVAATPGRRAPGHVDAGELAIRAVLGQQVSLAAARGLAARLAELCGEPLPAPAGTLTRAFPSPAAIAEADLDHIGMPGARRATLRALATALADGTIDLAPGAPADEAEARLLELRGVGPWTASYIRMRGLGDPDVLLDTDLGVRHALTRLGLAGCDDLAGRWRPWSSYAVHHLWASLGRVV
jgi:AraC family transcriptional regulator of adaptative response / DNA-3-methyladenine glycosylase II